MPRYIVGGAVGRDQDRCLNTFRFDGGVKVPSIRFETGLFPDNLS
jgi:hypothetical protein